MSNPLGGCRVMSDMDILLLTLASDATRGRHVEHLLTCGSRNARVADLRRVLAELAAEDAPEGSGRLQEALDLLRRAQRAADSANLALMSRAGLALARADRRRGEAMTV